jgi:DNA-binding IclR family transcriptional regulator
VRDTEPITVTARVLGILEAFSATRDHLSLSEIGRSTGLALSTAHRLINELVSWGALERDDDGRYRIGLRLWEVGSLAPRGLGLREMAMPFLEDLFQAMQENVQLAVLDGTDAVYLERISARRAVRVVTRAGSRLPLHASGVGLVLLANAPLELRHRILAGPLRRYTAHTITDPATLRHKLAEVRRLGYAVSDRQIEEVSISIAAPVFDMHDKVIAALSVVVPAESDQRRYVPAVVAGARGLSRSLGAPRFALPSSGDRRGRRNRSH